MIRLYVAGILLTLTLLAAPAGRAQVEAPAPRVMMNLAAHPDDEDALTMAYYRQARNAVVHSLIYTRGEGGQNEIGPELYAQLGAIRSAETEAAARHYGTQVRFLNFDDFGYSKTAEETFAQWGGEDAVTERLVYFIRKLKPDVLFTNHDTLTVGPRRQHGHHQAVGISAYRAMRLAADPAFHPEHLEEDGVDLWQPQRLFLRLWRGGQDTARVHVPVGEMLPGRGESASDIAVRGIAEHRSQGFDNFAPRFRQSVTYFALLAEAPDAPPLPEGATELDAGLPTNQHASGADLPHLIDAGRVPALPAGAVTLSKAVVVPGERFTIHWSAPEGHRFVLAGVVDTTLAASRAELRIPAGAAPTIPAERAQYDRHVNHPPVQAALYDPAGELVAAAHLPLEIAPPLTLTLEQAVVLPEQYVDRVLLRPGSNDWRVTGDVYLPDAEEVTIEAAVTRAEDGEMIASVSEVATVQHGRVEAAFSFELPDSIRPEAYDITITGWPDRADAGGEVLQLSGRVLPDVRVADGLRVGLVRSYDDATELALREMGVHVTPLDSVALASGEFGGLHTIVVDIRGYLVRPDLRLYNDRLLQWASDGGHLVVTYQKTFEWNEGLPDPFIEGAGNPPDFAPFSLQLGRDRVTRHDSPVTVLQPHHPLFNSPNQISEADWEGWIQERGLYFPADYDERFDELLAMNDPYEEPLNSSTLLARVGDGTYMYSALGWYRQLGAYVPGAYRLFANIVSLPLTDGRASR